MQRKSIPGFLINSVTPSETSTEFKKQMEEHMKLLTDSHPEIIINLFYRKKSIIICWLSGRNA
jgi:hypothetical protein